MTEYFGVDISKWNIITDYKALSQKSRFGMIRIGYGKKLDECFKKHYDGCKNAGISVGVYIYSLAQNQEEARDEAMWVLEQINDLEIDYPIALDYEDKSLIDAKLSKDQYTAICKAFIDEIKKANYYPIFYTNPDWIEYRLNKEEIFSVCDLWLAHWTKSGKEKQYGQKMWQFGTTTLDCVNGEIDGNYGYQDFSAYIRENGLNKPKKPQEQESFQIIGTKNVTGSAVESEMASLRKLGYTAKATKL